MDIKEIPKWLFVASFLALIVLMALSLAKETPFMIHGQAWGWQRTKDTKQIPSELLAPVGSIVAWDKGFSVKEIPEGWVECNGQLIHDDDSIYHNKNVPDLNAKSLFLRGGDKSREYQNESMRGHSHNFDLTKTTSATDNHAHAYSFDLRTSSNGGHQHDNGSVSSGHNQYQHEYAPFGLAGTYNARSPVVNDWPQVALRTGLTSSSDGHQHTLRHSGNTTALGTHSHNLQIKGSTSEVGENETRPINMSVVWIIRIK